MLPTADLPLALACNFMPQPQMPASGLRKPASNGHAEERADPIGADRERGAEQGIELMRRGPAEPVEAWHGFSCQWGKA